MPILVVFNNYYFLLIIYVNHDINFINLLISVSILIFSIFKLIHYNLSKVAGVRIILLMDFT